MEIRSLEGKQVCIQKNNDQITFKCQLGIKKKIKMQKRFRVLVESAIKIF